MTDLADYDKLLREIGANNVSLSVVEQSIKTLSPREEKVIHLTYIEGMSNNAAIAYVLDAFTGSPVTKARLKQIRDKALRKLQHKRRLGSYINGNQV